MDYLDLKLIQANKCPGEDVLIPLLSCTPLLSFILLSFPFCTQTRSCKLTQLHFRQIQNLHLQEKKRGECISLFLLHLSFNCNVFLSIRRYLVNLCQVANINKIKIINHNFFSMYLYISLINILIYLSIKPSSYLFNYLFSIHY